MNKALFTSNTDVWATPQHVFDEWNAIWNFTTDVCALPENAKCPHYYTPELDGLAQEWKGNCWMNPPYGRVIGKWVKKAHDAAIAGQASTVCLLPARTDTKWFHEFIYHQAEVIFLKGRLKFGGATNSAPFPSMMVIFHKDRITLGIDYYNKLHAPIPGP